MSKGKQSETGWAMTWVNELSDRCRQRWWDDTERHKEKKYFIDICCYNFNDAGRGRGGGGTDWKGRGIPPPAQRVLYRHHSFFLSPNVKRHKHLNWITRWVGTSVTWSVRNKDKCNTITLTLISIISILLVLNHQLWDQMLFERRREKAREKERETFTPSDAAEWLR